MLVWRTKSEYDTLSSVDEGRKRVLAIVAGSLMARHLKTTEDLFDNKPSPWTESLVGAAVRWAEKIMRKIETTRLSNEPQLSSRTKSPKGLR